jgi:hypothetical protein
VRNSVNSETSSQACSRRGMPCRSAPHQNWTPRCTGQCKQGYCSTGVRRLAQLPGQITCRKFLILQCQPEPHSGAHKQKISGRLHKGLHRRRRYYLPETWVPVATNPPRTGEVGTTLGTAETLQFLGHRLKAAEGCSEDCAQALPVLHSRFRGAHHDRRRGCGL